MERHLSSYDPEFCIFRNPILNRGSEGMDYPNPDYIPGAQTLSAFFTPIPLKEHLSSGYRSITKEVKTTIKRGSYTSRKFSGEWTLRQKQLVQERISKLLSAVIEATKTVNDTPTMEPNLATDKFLGYIFYGNE